ncbi:MAG TPA: prephenate dehydrogenase, partial [Sphingobacteriaceae bacterium]
DQKLIVIPHRATREAYQRMTDLLSVLTPDLHEITDYREHDRIVADTQAATHMGFECMGTAWKEAGFFPWENESYAGGIDHVKILTTLRIFSYKAHIYGGLAILNPYAPGQVRRYAQSESDLFKLMIREEEEAFRTRVRQAGEAVFKDRSGPLMLPDDLMQEYALSGTCRKPNSHLSLLSMVDAWHQLGIRPYDHLICQTPPFRLRLGIAEYLFRNEDLLEESMVTALYDKSIRADDLEFHSAVREWASMIANGDMEGYRSHFNAVKHFFKGRLDQGRAQSSELIGRLQVVRSPRVSNRSPENTPACLPTDLT